MKWFKHQSDARNSLKLRKVRRKYGANGYAIYWFCLEAIAYDIDKDNLTFELKEDSETIAFELSIQEKLVEEIMLFMVEIGLFESSSNMITCMKLAESIDKSMTNSPKMRHWLESKSVMTCADSVNTCAELEVELEVEVEKKEKKNKRIVSPSLDYSSWGVVSDQVLKDWKSLRTRLKAPVTQTVINRMAKEIQEAASFGWSADDCLAECAVRGWRGFKAEWVSGRRSSSLSAGEQTRKNLEGGF